MASIRPSGCDQVTIGPLHYLLQPVATLASTAMTKRNALIKAAAHRSSCSVRLFL